ncbi:MAG: PIN domain-containing protein [Rhodobacteraceae bacterium]|nr:PIN domain-containing protein [Paracoccaceae bacterium]
MGDHVALCDANVLYPTSIRDALVQLASDTLFRARWSDDIHKEWMRALLRDEPWRSRAALERTRTRMNAHAPGCLVEGYHDLIPSLDLPDRKDRHILAAAITGGCDVIIPRNLKDFPAKALTPHKIKAQHPDAFICAQIALTPRAVREAFRKVHARLKNPPMAAQEYLATLRKGELCNIAAALEPFL